MKLPLEFVMLAWSALRTQTLRAALSIVGVAIGMAAFTVTSAISQGGRTLIFSELETFGLHSVWVQRDYKSLGMGARQQVAGSGLDNDDYEVLQQGRHDLLRRVTPIVTARSQGAAQYGAHTSTGTVQGVGPEYFRINNDRFESGRTLNANDEHEARRVVVLGARTYHDLFGPSDQALGRHIRVANNTFEVVGVLQEKKRDFLNSVGIGRDDDPNRRILMPGTTLQHIDARNGEIDLIQVESSAKAAPGAVADMLKLFLRARHGEELAYRVDGMDQYVRTAQRIVDNVSLIGLSVSALSLLVGGIGIANVMMMSVIERVPEIGVRKAMGATRLMILGQFATEAVLIGLAGGFAGMLVACVLIDGAQPFSALLVLPTPGVLVASTFVAATVGAVAGTYPAWIASRLNPAEALRR